jgi:hypothetical protein
VRLCDTTESDVTCALSRQLRSKPNYSLVDSTERLMQQKDLPLKAVSCRA